MVKQKIQSISDGEWKDLRVKKETAKTLMLFKIQHDLLTYDQALNLMFSMLGDKQ
jgi:hypothetical protein